MFGFAKSFLGVQKSKKCDQVSGGQGLANSHPELGSVIWICAKAFYRASGMI
jgi:hypothetical protein